MPAMLGPQRITRGMIHLPRYGLAWADVETDGSELLSGSLSLSIGNLSLALDVERGAVSVSVGRYHLRAGLRWGTEIKPRGYQSDAGVRLRTVLRDLAVDALGKVGAASVVLPPERILGTAYARPGSDTAARIVVRAWDVLAMVAPRYYVDPAGRTIFAERIGGPVTAPARVLRRNLGEPLRAVATEEPAAFLPGGTFEGGVIGSTVIHIGSKDFSLELWGIAA